MLKNIRDRECRLLKNHSWISSRKYRITSRIRRGHVWSTERKTVDVEMPNKAKKKNPKFQAAVMIVVACGSVSSVSRSIIAPIDS